MAKRLVWVFLAIASLFFGVFFSAYFTLGPDARINDSYFGYCIFWIIGMPLSLMAYLGAFAWANLSSIYGEYYDRRMDFKKYYDPNLGGVFSFWERVVIAFRLKVFAIFALVILFVSSVIFAIIIRIAFPGALQILLEH